MTVKVSPESQEVRKPLAETFEEEFQRQHPESQEVPSTQGLPPTAKPGPVFATPDSPPAVAAPPSSLEPSAARLLTVLTRIESAGLTVAGYLARLQAQRDALSVEIAEVESFASLSEKFVPRTPSGRKRRVDAGQPRKRRQKTPATPSVTAAAGESKPK